MLGIKNHFNKTAQLDNDEKGLQSVESLGGIQKVQFCTEPGLYRIIFTSKSKNETVKKFKRWVFHEVLPSIRKTGEYRLQKEIAQLRQENQTIRQQASHRTVQLVLERNDAREEAEKNLDLPAWSCIFSRKGIRNLSKYHYGTINPRFVSMCKLVTELTSRDKVEWIQTTNGPRPYFLNNNCLAESSNVIDNWQI